MKRLATRVFSVDEAALPGRVLPVFKGSRPLETLDREQVEHMIVSQSEVIAEVGVAESW